MFEVNIGKPMSRVVDIFGFLLLCGATAAFIVGLQALADERDVLALFCLVVGTLVLRSASHLFKPKAMR